MISQLLNFVSYISMQNFLFNITQWTSIPGTRFEYISLTGFLSAQLIIIDIFTNAYDVSIIFRREKSNDTRKRYN